jgi:hypothetical protein
LEKNGNGFPNIEALGVMEVFTAFNKFLDSLQVEIDT